MPLVKNIQRHRSDFHGVLAVPQLPTPGRFGLMQDQQHRLAVAVQEDSIPDLPCPNATCASRVLQNIYAQGDTNRKALHILPL